MQEPKDISTELRRTYAWPDGAKVTIENPKSLTVSDNGHRVVDVENNGHYVPKGWIHLKWENRLGATPVVA